MIKIKKSKKIDDTLHIFDHGIGGICGMVLTAVFAQDVGLFYGEMNTLLHIGASIAVILFTFFGSLFLYKIVDLIYLCECD